MPQTDYDLVRTENRVSLATAAGAGLTTAATYAAGDVAAGLIGGDAVRPSYEYAVGAFPPDSILQGDRALTLAENAYNATQLALQVGVAALLAMKAQQLLGEAEQDRRDGYKLRAMQKAVGAGALRSVAALEVVSGRVITEAFLFGAHVTDPRMIWGGFIALGSFVWTTGRQFIRNATIGTNQTN